MPMISYITYDENGNLTGAYIQELQVEHADAYIVVSDDIRMWWVNYRANEARNEVELIPPSTLAPPDDPPPEPEPGPPPG